MTLIYIIVFGTFLWMLISLRHRVIVLETLVKKNGWMPEPGRPSITSETAVRPNFLPSSVPATHASRWSENFGTWLREDWLLKLGALLLLIGFGWLMTYAFLNNWIGPVGRIALGYFAGVVFLALGVWRMRRFPNQAGVFMVLGSTTVLITTFAARLVYDFFTPGVALVVMFMSTAFVGLASVKLKSRSLALVSLVLAGLAPLLTHSATRDYVSLFMYLFVVMAGALWIVALTGIRELTLAALIVIAFYSLPQWFDGRTAVTSQLLVIAYAFVAVFFLTSLTAILRGRREHDLPDIFVAGGNALFLLAWVMFAAPKEWQSLILVAWMLVFMAAAFAAFRVTRRRDAFYVYAGIGVTLLAAATAVELDGAALTIAFAVESAVVSVVAGLAVRDWRLAERLGALFFIPGVMALFGLTWRTGRYVSGFQAAPVVFDQQLFALAVMAVLLLGLGLFFYRRHRRTPDGGSDTISVAMMISGSVYFYILLWRALSVAYDGQDAFVTVVLLVFTVIGLATHLIGRTRQMPRLQMYGSALLVLVVARLLLVDVWKMALAGRIVTFFLVGALLMSTAFLGRRKSMHL
jgi:uncharacterized membrane protein